MFKQSFIILSLVLAASCSSKKSSTVDALNSKDKESSAKTTLDTSEERILHITEAGTKYSRVFSTGSENIRPLSEAEKLAGANESEYMVEIAEKLLNSDPLDFLLAEKLINHVLRKEPKHNKALFIKGAIGIAKLSEGAGKQAKLQLKLAEYEKFSRDILDTQNKALINFAFNPSKSIVLIKEYSDSVDYIKKNLMPTLNKAKELFLSINNEFVINVSDDRGSSLAVSCFEDPLLDFYCSQDFLANLKKKIKTITIDSIDLKVLVGSIDSILNNLIMVTAYNVDDAEELYNKIKPMVDSSTDEEISQVINDYPSLLTLNEKHELATINTSLDKMLKDALDFADMRATLCQNESREHNAIGDICISEDQEDIIEESISAMAGPEMVVLGHDVNGLDVNVLANASSLFLNPLADLKVLMPSKFDTRGKAVLEDNKALSGIFPNNDIVQKVKSLK